MELRDKKLLAERFIKLGMDKYKSLLAAECTQEEIDVLEDDKEFTNRIEWLQAKEVSVLLEKLQTVIEINKPRGISTEIRWLLGKLDAPRFGEGIKLNATSDKKKFVITFETSKCHPDCRSVLECSCFGCRNFECYGVCSMHRIGLPS